MCQFAFVDKCDAEFLGHGAAGTSGVDYTTIGTRLGWAPESGETTSDFEPSYLGTIVLDVPGDAKGTYVIDLNDDETYIQNCTSAIIPLAARNPGIIVTPCCDCGVDQDCDDGDVCTTDVCGDSCNCTITPVAGWNPATECCHPVTGVQAMVPPSTPCRAGGCSLGGSSGVPTLTDLDDGTPCTPVDPCHLPGVCEEGICVGEQYAGSDCPKSRFISFDVAVGSIPVAYRVRLVSLHQPDPPYSAGVALDFGILEGEYRWVGPPGSYVESSTDPTVVNASYLQCEPHYHDWSTISLVHVTGSEVVPSSLYEVQSIPIGLDPQVEAHYSDPIVIQTTRWGDVTTPYNPPDTSIQPDAGDLAAMLRKFRSLPGSILKPRSLMRSGLSDLPNLNVDVNFDQIAAVVDAFRGSPYPFAAPSPCP